MHSIGNEKKTLEILRVKNPNIKVYSVYDPEFARYGRILDFPAESLIEVCERTAVMPETGSLYVRSMPELEKLEIFTSVQDTLCGGAPCQIGCCWGYNSHMNALEYHRSSEHNIAVSDMVLILADQREMVGLDLPSGKPVAVFVPRGTVIELYATSMHYCPCQVSSDGFRCIVILPYGTNSPWSRPRPQGADGVLLWSQNKWMIAHPENKWAVSHGGYPGLHGENFTIQYE